MTISPRHVSRKLLASMLVLCAISGCSKEPKLSTQSKDALRAYDDGVVQFEKFYYREAEASFDQALRYDSTFAMAWARMAVVNANAKNEEQALADIDKAMRYSAGATRREQLFIRMWNNQLRFNIDAAIATADSLVHAYPDEKEAYLFRGTLLELNKNYEAAIKSYQRAIEADTGYALAVMHLGYAYSAVGEPEKAAAMMQRYIRLAPDAADPRASYADILMRVGRYDEALAQYKKSLELKPDYWYAVQSIGNIYAIMGRLKDAEQQFHASLKLLPQNRQLESLHLQADGVLNIQRADYAAAIGQFTRALEIDTSNFDAAYGLVYALDKTRRFDEGAEMIARIKRELEHRNLTGSTAMMGFHLMQSRHLMEKGDLVQARAECDSAVGFSSVLTRGAVYRQLAEIYRRDKAYEPALDACDQALSVNPNQPEVLLTLVRVYHDKGDQGMTQEIGSRLNAFWADADADYQNKIELHHLLGKKG